MNKPKNIDKRYSKFITADADGDEFKMHETYDDAVAEATNLAIECELDTYIFVPLARCSYSPPTVDMERV